MQNNHRFLMECAMLNLERKANVIQCSSGFTNQRMTESGWLAFNLFNRSDTSKRMNDADIIRLLLHYRWTSQRSVCDLVDDFAMKREWIKVSVQLHEYLQWQVDNRSQVATAQPNKSESALAQAVAVLLGIWQVPLSNYGILLNSLCLKENQKVFARR